MDKKLDKLEAKLDKLDERLDQISTTLAVNTASLVEHIKRTNKLEERTEYNEKHVLFINNLFKIGGSVAGLAAFLLAVLEIIRIVKQ